MAWRLLWDSSCCALRSHHKQIAPPQPACGTQTLHLINQEQALAAGQPPAAEQAPEELLITTLSVWQHPHPGVVDTHSAGHQSQQGQAGRRLLLHLLRQKRLPQVWKLSSQVSRCCQQLVMRAQYRHGSRNTAWLRYPRCRVRWRQQALLLLLHQLLLLSWAVMAVALQQQQQQQRHRCCCRQ